MHANPSAKLLRIAWWFTGAVALLLAAGTLVMAGRALGAGEKGTPAYVTGANPSVTLRGEPSGVGRVLGVVSRGQEVLLITTSEREGVLWANVYVDGEYGWLPATNLSSHPPAGSQ